MVSIAFSLSIEFDSDLFALELLPSVGWVSWEQGLYKAIVAHSQKDWDSCHLNDTDTLI